MKLSYTIKSVTGVSHRMNQDGYIIKTISLSSRKPDKTILLENETFLVCIGDGIGGGKDGDVASSILLKTAKYYITLKYLQKFEKKE